MNILYWKDEPRLVAGTTLRNPSLPQQNNMALHTGGDENAIIENRQALAQTLGISLADCSFAQQTHSHHMKEVTADMIGKGSCIYTDGFADCDALYTKQKNALIGIFHADCVPILLYDPIQELVAAIHSGWQGTIKEITHKSIAYLKEHEQINPENLLAYIGPAINYESLEVGMEVVEQVRAMSFPTDSFMTLQANGKALIDNKGLNKQMLLHAGIKENHILVNRSDTFLPNESLFSYRRDHACGRHLSFIMMRKPT